MQVVGQLQGWPGDTMARSLAFTMELFLLEMDGGGVVSCRALRELARTCPAPKH